MNNFNINIEEQLSRLGKDIQQFVEKNISGQYNGHDFEPNSDVLEGKEEYKIVLDLPGLNKRQVKITLKKRVLTVNGERELFLEDDEKLIRSERKQGAFSRAFALPNYADEKTVKAEFKQGVLSISLKKTGFADDADATSIPIK